jgi:hypothetical protein
MKYLCRLGENQGHVLLASLMLSVVLALLGMTALYLAGQNAPGVFAMKEQIQSQQLTEAASDLMVSWFHDLSTVPPSLAGLLAKRQNDAMGGPSFFDMAGHSQFVGTPDRPDILLDAGNDSDDRLLNSAPSGFSGPLSELGHLEAFKMYAPTEPGLLGTLEIRISTRGRRPLASTIRFQLGALNIPALRAAVQTGQGLGALPSSEASLVLAHWGDVRVMGDMAVNRAGDFVIKSPSASVTGQSYESMGALEDRWTDYWIGGAVAVLSSPTGESSALPSNVHARQQPIPGIRPDRWDYDLLKKTAQRHGTYYRLDRDGRLHLLGALASDPGLVPAEVLASSTVGQSHGLIFIDTMDGEAPRPDNLGTLVLDADYVEALLVVQGHVLFKPGGPGRSMTVLSPPPEGVSSLGARIPVTLSGIHLNGLLYAAGTIRLERDARVYGAVMTDDTVGAGNTTPLLEVWYNWNFGNGLFRGLPVVYRAPATWQVKY